MQVHLNLKTFPLMLITFFKFNNYSHRLCQLASPTTLKVVLLTVKKKTKNNKSFDHDLKNNKTVENLPPNYYYSHIRLQFHNISSILFPNHFEISTHNNYTQTKQIT